MSKPRIVQSLDTGLRVLLHMTQDSREWSIAELHRDLGTPKSVIHSALATLAKYDLVEQNEDTRRYRIGVAGLLLGQAASKSLQLPVVARPIMERLAAEVNESAYLVICRDDRGVLIDRADPAHPLRVTMEIGMSRPMYAGASFKALLAYLPQEVIARILDGPLEQVGPKSPASREEIEADLARIRALGYSYTEEETVPETAGIAAPVFDAAGRAVASVSVAGVVSRFRSRREQLVEAVVRAAAMLSERLGYVKGA